MLLLEFSVAARTYALPAKSVVEVVPAVALNRYPGQVPTLEYHGFRVPVLDLAQRYCGTPTVCSLATRIVLVGHSEHGPALGLLVEHVIDTVRVRALNPADSALISTPVPISCVRDERGDERYLLNLDQVTADVIGAPNSCAEDGA